MMEGHAAGRSTQGRGATTSAPISRGSTEPQNRPSPPMAEHRPQMAARGTQQQAVVQGDIDQHHSDRQDVVFGVQIEGPVLMPFHWRAEMRRFHFQLGAVRPQVLLAEQRPAGLDHRRGPHQPVECRWT
jgi:hypothetical protein